MNLSSRLELLHNDLLDIADQLESLHLVHPVGRSALGKVQRHLVSACMDLHLAQIAEACLRDPAPTPA